MRTARHVTFGIVLTVGLAAGSVGLAQRGGQQGLTDAQTRSAAIEVPRLVEVLQLEPGMRVADVGAGFGAWTRRFAEALGPEGRVYATDIGALQLEALRAAAAGGLVNVTVLEGAERSTNLPVACCDAILIRDAYHHLSAPADVVRSLVNALKPGGRLAVVDFPPRPGSSVSPGVPANRGGHGVPPEVVVEEVTAQGLRLIGETRQWSPNSSPDDLFLLVFEKS